MTFLFFLSDLVARLPAYVHFFLIVVCILFVLFTVRVHSLRVN